MVELMSTADKIILRKGISEGQLHKILNGEGFKKALDDLQYGLDHYLVFGKWPDD